MHYCVAPLSQTKDRKPNQSDFSHKTKNANGNDKERMILEAENTMVFPNNLQFPESEKKEQ